MSYDNIKQQYGKEHINIVEIDVPRCVNTYGVSPCTATGSGDAKCYNTLATCQDLPNYNDEISTGTATISFNATNRTFTRSAGSYLTDGFEVGMTITASGYANEGNNSQFIIESVTATVITITSASNYGTITEAGSGDEVITAKNLYTYKFCTARSPHPQNMNFYYPCINSISVAPSKINPKGGIGGRSSVGIQFTDFPSSDLNDVDPYLSDRTYTPFDIGSFWTRWRTRNAYYENYAVRHLSGYIVDNAYDEANFNIRHYVMASMTATRGAASITAKDPLQKVSNKKALAPRPSEGTLASDLASGTTSSMSLATGTGDGYPSGGGKVKIRDEIISYASRTGDTLSTLTRGENNTIAADHDTGDTVQLVLEYSGSSMDEVLIDLIETYAEIDSIYLDKAQWAAEVSTYLSSNPSAIIADPVKVDQLIAELTEQWPSKIYWDDRANKIKMTAIKAPPTSANIIDMEQEIISDSFNVNDKPEMQVSTVYVYYGQFDPTKKLDETDNYVVTYARVNTDASFRYNSNETKTVYSRWISSTNGAAARQMAALIGRRFGFVPRECNFAMDDKDSDLWISQVRAVNHRDIVDQNGNPVNTLFEIIQAKEGNVYEYTGLEYLYDEALPEDEGGGDPDTDLILLDIDEQNVNLYDRYVSLFGTPDASTKAKFVVDGGVVIGSSSTGTPAIETGSSWVAGGLVTLQVNSGGYVVGRGGDGSSDGVSAGGDGGDALNMTYDLTLVNNGIIGGGGGGGGSSSADNYTAAGGGGAGDDVGSGGTNDTDGDGTVTNASFAEDGTLENGGAGGSISYQIGGEPSAVGGGAGGDLGENGSNGLLGGTSGGSAGAAINKNGNTLTETVTGDIRGSVA